MATIEVDWEVYRGLVQRRVTEDTTFNDVLRDMLDLNPVVTTPKTLPTTEPGWARSGVFLKAGTLLKATHNGRALLATITDGRIEVRGKEYTSPSAAAKAVTSTSINGWDFWHVEHEGKWKPLGELRPPKSP